MADSNTYQARYKQGNPCFVDHTAASAIAVGDVVVQGHVPMVAHAAIANGADGSLSVGGGIYNCASDAAIAVGQPVWWNDTDNEVTETASGNNHFGFTVAASVSDKVDVFHAPQGLTGAIV